MFEISRMRIEFESPEEELSEDIQGTRRGYKLASWRYFSRPRLAVFDKTFTWHSDLTCDLQRGNFSHSNIESWKCCDTGISLPPRTSSKHLISSRSGCSALHSPLLSSLTPSKTIVPYRKKRRRIVRSEVSYPAPIKIVIYMSRVTNHNPR
jgi:hypothetical protein